MDTLCLGRRPHWEPPPGHRLPHYVRDPSYAIVHDEASWGVLVDFASVTGIWDFANGINNPMCCLGFNGVLNQMPRAVEEYISDELEYSSLLRGV